MDEKVLDFLSELGSEVVEKIVSYADKVNCDRDTCVRVFANVFFTLVNRGTFKNYELTTSDDPAES